MAPEGRRGYPRATIGTPKGDRAKSIMDESSHVLCRQAPVRQQSLRCALDEDNSHQCDARASEKDTSNVVHFLVLHAAEFVLSRTSDLINCWLHCTKLCSLTLSIHSESHSQCEME